MKREIKTTLALDGEAKFKQGLQSIDRELRVMSSQLNMLSSEYNANAGSIDNLTQRYNLMQDNVTASQSKVDILKEAVNKSSEAYDKAVQNLETMIAAHGKDAKETQAAQKEVAKAEATMDGYKIKLANAENQLNRNIQALRNFETENSLAVDEQKKFEKTMQNLDSDMKLTSARLNTLSSEYNKNSDSISSLIERHKLMQKQVESSQSKVNELKNALNRSQSEYDKAVQKAKEMAEAHGENSDEAKLASQAVERAKSSVNQYSTQLANAENQLNQNTHALNQFESENRGFSSTGKKSWETVKNAVGNTVQRFQDFFAASKAEKFQMINVAVAKITPTFGQIAAAIASVTKNTAEMSLKLTAEIGKISFKSAEAGVQAFVVTTEKSLEVSLKAFTAYTENIAKLGTKIGKWAVETGMSFDSQMSTVAAISGAEGEAFDILSEKAKEMGETTSFSATESAKALEYMAMAGWKPEEMEVSLEHVINLAAASGEELEMVSDIVTDAMTAFGMSADETQRFADVLAKTASNANTKVGIMGETFQYVAPLAGAMNYSIEDMSVAIGLMANAGVKGSMSGTALRNIITSLVKPTDEVATAMNELGVSLTDSKGNTRSFKEVVGQLRDGFAGLTDTEKASYAATIAGERGMSGLLAIVNSSEKDFDELTAAISESSGAAENMADIRIDNLQGDITLLKSNIEGVGISISDKFNPSLRWAVQSASDLVTAFKEDGISGALKHFSTLIPKISEGLSKSLPSMLGSFMAGINGIIISLVKSINQLLPSFTDKVLPVALTQFTNLMTRLTAKIPELLPNIVESGLTLFNGLLDSLNTVTTKLIGELPEIVSGIGEKLLGQGFDLLDKSIQLFENLVTAVETVADLLLPKIPGIIDRTAERLIEKAPDLLDSALTLFEKLIESLDNVAEKLLPKLPELITNICNKLIEHIDDIIDTGFDLLVGLSDGIVKCIPTLLKKIPEVITKLVTEFTKPDNLSQLLQAGIDLIVALAEGLPQAVTAIAEAVPKVTKNIIDTFMETDWGQVGKDIVNGILSGFLDMDFQVDEYINEFGDNWITGIKDIFGIHSPSKLMRDEVGKWLLPGLLEGVDDTVNQTTDGINKDIDDIVNNLNSPEINLPNIRSSEIEAFGNIPEFPETTFDIKPLLNNNSLNHIFGSISELFNTAFNIEPLLNDDSLKSISNKISDSIPKEFDTMLIIDTRYLQNFKRMDNVLSGNITPSNSVTNNYNTTRNSPVSINITIQNANLNSRQDISETAEKLAFATKQHLAGLGLCEA